MPWVVLQLFYLVFTEEISFDLQVICFLVLFCGIGFFSVYGTGWCWLGVPFSYG